MNGLPFVCLILVIGSTGTRGFLADTVTSQHGDVLASGPTQKSEQLKPAFETRLKQLDVKSKETSKGASEVSKPKQPDPPHNMTDEQRDAMLFPDSRPLRMDPLDALPLDDSGSQIASVPSNSAVPDTYPPGQPVYSLRRSPIPTTSQSYSVRNQLGFVHSARSKVSITGNSAYAHASSSVLPSRGSYQRESPRYNIGQYQLTGTQSVNSIVSLPHQSPMETLPIYSQNPISTPTDQFGSRSVGYTESNVNNLPPYRPSRISPNRGRQTRYQPVIQRQVYRPLQYTNYVDRDYTGCGASCTNYCLFGYETDTSVCNTCTCRRSAFFVCHPPACPYVCPFGSERNVLGCDTCTCKTNPFLDAMQNYLRTRLIDFSAFFQD